MASSRVVYVKTRVPNYYGLAGVRNEYCKLIVRGEAVARCGKVFAGGRVFGFDKAVSCHLITKQEYQEATGDYTCDDVEFLSESNNETYTDADGFDAKLDRIPFEIAAVLTLFLVVILL